MKNEIDEMDRKILAALRNDARKPVLEIARELDVTRTTVNARLNRLREKKILRGTKLDVDEKALGYHVSAFVGLTLTDKASYADVKRALKKIPEITEIHATAGGYNMLIKVIVPDVTTLHDLLTKRLKRPGVHSTETYLILDTYLSKDIEI